MKNCICSCKLENESEFLLDNKMEFIKNLNIFKKEITGKKIRINFQNFLIIF